MIYAKGKNRFLLCIIVLVLVVCTLFGVGHPTIAYASEREISYEKTNVLDDLKSSTVNGKTFDIKDYPFDDSRDVQIISFVEYCYSFRANLRDNYGLYVYVYNPKGLNLVGDSKQNKIQMATSYDSEGIPTSYTKFNLELCSKVEEGNYKNLFYKFKVVDKKVNGKTFSERVNSNERRYDISGIEILTYGKNNATEYGVGGTYIFTGYAKGYGPDENAESNLFCVVEDLETLELTVHHTNFRTNVSSLGPDHYNEVNTVYFSVPERIFDTYGNLQKIRAEWWEYKTKMAAITSNYEYYEKLLQYVGTYTGEHNSSVDNYLYSGYEGQSGQGYANHYFDWTYNKSLEMESSLLFTQTYFSKKVSDIMPYAFYSPTVNIDSVFSFLYSDPIAGDVESTQVKEWIYNYSNDLGNGYIDCNGRPISIDLFEDSVDEGRTMGYNDKTIDLSDTFDLNSYDSNHSWWDKLWDYGFSWPATNGDYKNVAPIYEVKTADLTGSNADISSRLLVNVDDVPHLKEFYDKEVGNGNRVILFRFANTDYYCAPAFTPHTEIITNTDTYVAQQTVFFDFDIIELTFNKDGVYRVIPVVSSPTDIINGFSQPPTQLEWWKIILAVLLIILLVIILWPIMPYIVRFIWWLICLPFKLITWLIQSISKSVKKRKEKKKQKQLNKEE